MTHVPPTQVLDDPDRHAQCAPRLGPRPESCGRGEGLRIGLYACPWPRRRLGTEGPGRSAVRLSGRRPTSTHWGSCCSRPSPAAECRRSQAVPSPVLAEPAVVPSPRREAVPVALRRPENSGTPGRARQQAGDRTYPDGPAHARSVDEDADNLTTENNAERGPEEARQQRQERQERQQGREREESRKGLIEGKGCQTITGRISGGSRHCGVTCGIARCLRSRRCATASLRSSFVARSGAFHTRCWLLPQWKTARS